MLLISNETAFNTVSSSWWTQFTIMVYFCLLCTQFHYLQQYFLYYFHIKIIKIICVTMINAISRNCIYLNWNNLYWEIKLQKNTNLSSFPSTVNCWKECFTKQTLNVSHWSYFLITTASTGPYCLSAASFKWLFSIRDETREWTLTSSVATKNMETDSNQSFLYTLSLPFK